MYEVGTAREVRALHVMPGMAGPEGQLHHHDYRIEVVVRRAELDDRGMVCDLDVLEAALTDAVAQVQDRDLEVIRPDDAEAVTVEVFARWVHTTLAAALNGGSELQVRVYESPQAFEGYAAPVANSS